MSHIEYWTLWGGSWSNGQVCSTHRTLSRAMAAAKACEKRGGAKHDIYRIEKVKIRGERASALQLCANKSDSFNYGSRETRSRSVGTWVNKRTEVRGHFGATLMGQSEINFEQELALRALIQELELKLADTQASVTKELERENIACREHRRVLQERVTERDCILFALEDLLGLEHDNDDSTIETCIEKLRAKLATAEKVIAAARSEHRNAHVNTNVDEYDDRRCSICAALDRYDVETKEPK